MLKIYCHSSKTCIHLCEKQLNLQRCTPTFLTTLSPAINFHPSITWRPTCYYLWLNTVGEDIDYFPSKQSDSPLWSTHYGNKAFLKGSGPLQWSSARPQRSKKVGLRFNSLLTLTLLTPDWWADDAVLCPDPILLPVHKAAQILKWFKLFFLVLYQT